MEELTRPQGDKPFGWFEALRRLWRRAAVKAVPPRAEPRRADFTIPAALLGP
jgi:hypothetical protein